jgi:hypothetical protein
METEYIFSNEDPIFVHFLTVHPVRQTLVLASEKPVDGRGEIMLLKP